MESFFRTVAMLVILSVIASTQSPAAATADPQSFSPAASEPILPPLPPWDGKSRELIAAKDDPWLTPAEKTDFRLTPSYEETVAWLRKLVAAAPQLKMVSLGKSPEGRDLWMIVASREGASTPEALRKNGKPIVLAQAGIHSGEIDGKDAGLMLLRDMTVAGKRGDLLEQANLLFVPIFNVDGHERTTKFGRVNQRGPEVMGWRTTAKNINLNRDYAKADAPEMAAMLRAINQWQPDLYLDIHVTDGADYQYDVTFGFNGSAGHSPAISGWLEKTFNPTVTVDLTAMGHIPGPVDSPNWIDPKDLSKGIRGWLADPRFSNGYGDARHLPTVLIENHSLKPYQQRVLGTYVFLESTLRITGKTGAALRQAIAADRAAQAPTIPLAWEIDPQAPNETIEYKAIESRAMLSPISGAMRLEFTGKPADREDTVSPRFSGQRFDPAAQGVLDSSRLERCRAAAGVARNPVRANRRGARPGSHRLPSRGSAAAGHEARGGSAAV